MIKRIFLDAETFNATTDIRAGTYVYAETCELLLLGYLIEDDKGALRGPYVWDATADPIPSGFKKALHNPTIELVAHNAQFDRQVLHHTLGLDPDPYRWHCTMARALAHSLPGALGALGPIFGIKESKQRKEEGRKLVLKFCKLWPTHNVHHYNRHNAPNEWEKFKDYCREDVMELKHLYDSLPSWNYTGKELDAWHLDQVINDRGIAVDLDLANAAIKTTEKEKRRLARKTQQATNNEVEAATQRDKLLQFILKEYDIDLPNMQKATLERRMNDPDLPDPVRELLSLRLQATKTSTSKYKAFIKASNTDGRVRGMLQFAGASRTGRWSGRIVQLQNLPRPTMDTKDIEEGIEAIKNGTADLLYDNVMDLASNAIRGCLVAAPGKKLVISDWSNIEGRMLTWLAGEKWKLKAFRDFDAGTGPDLYNLAYANSFGVAVDDVTKEQRQIGKVEELALGYGGGVAAFVSMAMNYKMDLAEMADQVIEVAPVWALEEAKSFWQWAKNNDATVGLSSRVFVGCDIVKRVWRKANPRIVKFWYALEENIRHALANPGVTFDCGYAKIRKEGQWLLIRLPSGRFLCYPQAHIDSSGTIRYMGVNQYSRKWQKLKSWGGKFAENVTQAASRDVLRDGIFRAEEARYQVILSVHDEPLTEVPDTEEYSVTELNRLLAKNSEWNKGLPLAAAGFEAYRYRKE